MKIQPIRSEADYDKVLARIEKLWGATEGTQSGDQLDVLLILVEDYESRHHPIDPPDPIEAIKFRMEQMNLSRKDLEPLIGSRGRVTEIINGRRPLTLTMIRKLHQSLGIPLESLIRDTAPGRANSRLTRAPSSPRSRRSRTAARH